MTEGPTEPPLEQGEPTPLVRPETASRRPEAEEAPSGTTPPSRLPVARRRLAAAVVAFVVFGLAAGFAWLAFRPSSSSDPASAIPGSREPSASENALTEVCPLLTEAEIGRALDAEVSRVRPMKTTDFIQAPGKGSAACSYQTGEPYGALVLFTQPMNRKAFDRKFAERDPANTRNVSGVGENAVFYACGDSAVYADGRLVQLSVQFASCDLIPPLRSLATSVLDRLEPPG